MNHLDNTPDQENDLSQKNCDKSRSFLGFILKKIVLGYQAYRYIIEERRLEALEEKELYKERYLELKQKRQALKQTHQQTQNTPDSTAKKNESTQFYSTSLDTNTSKLHQFFSFFDFARHFKVPACYQTNKKGFILLPVLTMALGMSLYFDLSFEPNFMLIHFIFFGLIGVLSFLFYQKRFWRFYSVFHLTAFIFGLLIAQYHCHFHQANFINPIIERATIKGEIISSITQDDGYLITINVNDIQGVSKDKLPQKARLFVPKFALLDRKGLKKGDCTDQFMFDEMSQKQTLQQKHRFSSDSCAFYMIKPPVPQISDIIEGNVFSLHPPTPPAYLNSYHQQRSLWFENITAIGTFYRARLTTPQKIDDSHKIEKMRVLIADKIDNSVSSLNKGILKALILGESRYIDASLRDLYRSLGLSHLLAVSGFHIGLIAFFIYFLISFLLKRLIKQEGIIHLIATIISLSVSGLYTLIAGAHSPAIRAFLMVVLVAVWNLIGKTKISILYFFGITAFLMLIYNPQLSINAGFQLSFLAVLTLITLVSRFEFKIKEKLSTQPVLASLIIFVTLSIIVSLSTAPVVLYHFHQFPVYGIIGNILLSSLYTFIVMPFLFLGCLLMPFGYHDKMLDYASHALDDIHAIGYKISAFPNNMLITSTFLSWGLACFIFGFVWFCLFKKRLRLIGLIFILIAPLSFCDVRKPDFYIGAQGRLLSVRQKDDSLWLNESYYHKQISSAWLLGNGQSPQDYVSQKFFPKEYIIVKGKKIAFSSKHCQSADLTIATKKRDTYFNCPRLIDKNQLATSTPLFLFIHKNEIEIRSAYEYDKERPWGITLQNIPSTIESNESNIQTKSKTFKKKSSFKKAPIHYQKKKATPKKQTKKRSYKSKQDKRAYY